MKSNYKQLGQFIRQVDVRNSEGKEENLLGVSVQKKFIPSIANTVGTDFKKYKVVKKGQFTYIPDTSRRGDKIGIALLEDYEEGLVSNVYTVFEIIDEKQLIPEYLMLWFSRTEFDRYARFKSHGSVREVMDWDEMCKVELPVPPYEKQKEIVDGYKAITERIALKQKINDNLDSQISTLYKEYFSSRIQDEIPNGWEFKTVQECGFDISDGNYSSKYPKYNEFVPDGIPFIRGTDFTGKYISIQNALFITPEMHADLKKGHTKRGDILVSTRGEIGKIAFVPDTLIDANINSQLVRINANGVLPRVYMAYSFLSETVRNEIKSLITGSVQEQLPIGKLQKVHILFPDSKTLDKFCNAANPLLNNILENEHEVVLLTQLQAVMLETLSSR